MNIGIDATSWWNNRGFGRFTRELLTALFQLDSGHKFYLITDQPPDESMNFAGVEPVPVSVRRPTTRAAVAHRSRAPADLIRLYRAVAACPLDIMFYPAVYSWFPIPRRIPGMVTVHDAIAEHFPKLVFPDWKSRLFWTLKVKLALWNCRRILTVSNAAKQEIVEYMGADPTVIDVTSEAPGPMFRAVIDEAAKSAARRRAGLPLDVRMIMYVGGLAPHKNLDGLLDGFALAQASTQFGKVHLALVGDIEGAGFHSNYRHLRDRVNTEPALRDCVHFTGWVPDDDLAALYSSALAIAMPSFSEGFGLPAIEAMACAVPVLASNQGALPEVVGEAGIYFDPHDAPGIAGALTHIVSDHALRRRLSAAAKTRASGFTWQRTAEETLRYLEQMRGA